MSSSTMLILPRAATRGGAIGSNALALLHGLEPLVQIALGEVVDRGVLGVFLAEALVPRREDDLDLVLGQHRAAPLQLGSHRQDLSGRLETHPPLSAVTRLILDRHLALSVAGRQRG